MQHPSRQTNSRTPATIVIGNIEIFRTIKRHTILKRYGIIGKPLGHSFSEKYFTEKFASEAVDAIYRPYPIETIAEVQSVLQALDGFNVTYPYKESIIPYLHNIDPIAREIGAVNVVASGKGYNSDWIGFRNSLTSWDAFLRIPAADHRALLLGTGGVSKAIQYALREMGIAYTLVSRSPSSTEHDKYALGTHNSIIGYNQLDASLLEAHSLIINCTPLGMSPYECDKPSIPYESLSSCHLLYDCIYNPAMTLFLQEGKKHGCHIKNGLEMLHRQADEAWQIWSQQSNA